MTYFSNWSQFYAFNVRLPSPDGRALDCAHSANIADYRLRDDETGDKAIPQIQSHWSKDIEALIVTGDTDPQRLRQAQQSGFAFLHKPFSPGKLRAFLRTTLSNVATS
jgi:DNA-binding NtrC family response regulator